MKQSYIPKNQRKKILLLSDDIRMQSGIATMAREIVVGTSHRYNWVNLGAGVNHPEHGSRLDLSADTDKHSGITDSNIVMYPHNGYGSPEVIRQLLELEKPDAIMFFTDPRYWIWLFQMENEIRKSIPMIYLNIWDNYPAPLYNKSYYESCDTLMAISKQTLNINKLVLGSKKEGKTLKYVPHGINHTNFYPITEEVPEQWNKLQAFKNDLLKGKEYEYIVFYNARNIRRKSTSDLILTYSQFCEKIGAEKAKKCLFLLHTQPVDENGTDLPVVVDLLCNPEYCNIQFTGAMYGVEEMNYLYNLSDVTALISSNEGWGLSLTESMMCGKMIIGNVTGGMQDQMRFEDKEGKWIDFDENFCSNHYGTYKKCGEWAVPVFPSNMSLVGSVPTPYIFDDRCDFRDVTDAIEKVYNLSKEERQRRGELGRKWVTSDESMMSAINMCYNVVDCIDETLETFKPKPKFEFIKVQDTPRKTLQHKIIY